MWVGIFFDIIFPYLRRLLHRVSTIAAANFLIPDVFLLIVSEMFDTQKNHHKKNPKKSKAHPLKKSDIVCSVSNTSETIDKNTSAIRKLAAAIVDTRQKSLLR